MVDSEEKTLTVGEKLLKEPIWIGMIVILNLVLFFCISYVIRRKCGQRISNMIPSRKKSTSVSPKESKAESPSVDRSVFSLSVETPRVSTATRPKLQIKISELQKDKSEPSCSNTISGPTTPVINEYNREAALKMFASYKAEKQNDSTFSQLSVDRNRSAPNVREDFITCGFQGGAVSFSDDEDLSKDIESIKALPKQMIRSKSSEMRPSDSSDPRIKRVFTYPDPKSPKPIKGKVGSSNPEHCYPEIRIVNEFNEECRSSDTDTPVNTESPKLTKALSVCKSFSNEHIPLSKLYENHDSGYPSTSTVSSNNTNSTSQEIIKHVHSASERRKMFGSKSKSTSFYKLSDQTHEADNEDEFSASTTKFNKKEMDCDVALPKLSRSFDAGRVCSCHNDRLKFSINSFSCESDLERFTRLRDQFNFCKRHESCGRKRQQRRHKCGCVKRFHFGEDSRHSRHGHRHSSRTRYSSKYTSPTSRYLSLSEIREIKRNHKRALARLSSTDSEGYECEYISGSTYKRPAYMGREHYSDGCVSCLTNRRHTSSSDRSPSIHCHDRDHEFKCQMMESFLSDTYRSSMRMSDHADSQGDQDNCRTKPLITPKSSIKELSTSVFQTRVHFNNSVSPSPEALINDPLTLSRPCPSPMDESATDIKTQCDTIKTVVNNNVEASDSISRQVKDSAYQTKQSSVETFNAVLSKDEVLRNINPLMQTDLDTHKRSDSVRRHLQQAALKLLLLKRLYSSKQESKDSAIQMVSEDEMSIDDDARRSLGKRAGATIAIQMKDIILSQVTEEHSEFSRDSYDSNNTPNNEKHSDSIDNKNVLETKHFTDFINDDTISCQETVV